MARLWAPIVVLAFSFNAQGGHTASEWTDCVVDAFQDIGQWAFQIGNGSPRPGNLTDVSPPIPRASAVHNPGWGNMELQNYDSISASTGPGGLTITPSVRQVTESEFKTGADYRLYMQSGAKRHIQWNGSAFTAGAAADNRDFPLGCENATSCHRLFVNVGCRLGDLTQCRIGFVSDSWMDTSILSSHSDLVDDESTFTMAKAFDGNLDASVTWTLTFLGDGRWTIQSNRDRRYLSTRNDQLKCVTSPNDDNGQLLPAVTWNLTGVFSSRINWIRDVSLPYKITGSIQVPRVSGTWPTFWLLPSTAEHGAWPEGGEIDIFDHVANDGNEMHAVVHTKDWNWLKESQYESITSVTGAASNHHKYELEATTHGLLFFIDGKEVLSYPNSGKTGGVNYPFDTRFHILLNVAVGGNWGAKDGVDFAALQDSSAASMSVQNVTICRGAPTQGAPRQRRLRTVNKSSIPRSKHV